MRRIIFHLEAEAEVDAAFDWYWSRSPNAAVGFLDELAEVQARIAQNPASFPHAGRTLRKAVLQRYPYYLLFRKSTEGIEVLVVAHAKRRPGYWKSRL